MPCCFVPSKDLIILGVSPNTSILFSISYNEGCGQNLPNNTNFPIILQPYNMTLSVNDHFFLINYLSDAGAVKIGAIYSLNVGSILNNADEQELCKVRDMALLRFL